MKKIIDLHCDALLRLQQEQGKLSFKDNDQMHITYENLKAGGVKVQAFAIFIYPDVTVEEKYANALEQVKYFHEEVVGKNEKIIQIKKWTDIDKLADDEIGVFLTLESVESIGNDLNKLTHLLDEGVLSVGLTWNPANLACDGITEKRGAGLSNFGFEIVELLNSRDILIDVSHISIAGFWDVMEHAKYPLASHSNVKELCSHIRNLADEQIDALIKRGGQLHVVYAPQFIKDGGNVGVEDLFEHISYIIDRGGAKNLGLGSDFDGIDSTPTGLKDASESQNIIKLIAEKYGDEIAEDIAFNNFYRYVK
jgi:Zn-dependent dipeptidase, microsomal dipeptidase homolog